MKKNLRQSQHLLSAVGMAVLGLCSQAQAQEAALERVEVTGSSIRRVENEAALPVSVLKAEDFTKAGITTLGDLLQALPQALSLLPSNAGAGTIINLRGLGSNRTLVLLNGRRLSNEPTSDGLANIDILPISALERVEVLNDGASSTYGSDAIAGVVNFITKRQYQGVEISGQASKPQHSGGGNEQGFNITAGTGDLNKDGWNVYATFNHHQKALLLEKDRPMLGQGSPAATSVGSSGYGNPANIKVGTAYFNPYGSTGCTPGFTGAASGNSLGGCILDPNATNVAIYPNQQENFYAKGTLKISADHTLYAEYNRGQTWIDSLKNPGTSAGSGSTFSALAGSALPANYPTSVPGFTITTASPWFPGGSGGVPAISGLSAAATNKTAYTLLWQAPGGMAEQIDTQLNQRFVLNDQGRLEGWDYKAGFVAGSSDRTVSAAHNVFDGSLLQQGFLNGSINPFSATQNATGQAALDAARLDGTAVRRARTTITGVDAQGSRELMELDGGPLAIALGANALHGTFHDQKLAAGQYSTFGYTAPTLAGDNRNVLSAFAELNAPVTKELTLNGAVRDDHYSDVGNTFNPKLSFRFQPSQEVILRGAASTGFRAPSMNDSHGYSTPGATNTAGIAINDPFLCPNGVPQTTLSGYNAGNTSQGQNYASCASTTVNGTTKANNLPTRTSSNPLLKPETSKTFTLGVVFEPAKDLNLSFDYWHIGMNNVINALPMTAVAANPAAYSNLFVRDANNNLLYINNVTANLGSLRESGIDVTSNYRFLVPEVGQFGIGLDGTYLLNFENQVTPGAAWVNNVGQFGNVTNAPIANSPTLGFRWRHNLHADWTNGAWTTRVTELFTSSYQDQNTCTGVTVNGVSCSNHTIPSYSLVNLSVAYSGIKDLTLIAGVNNVFNRLPPATNNTGTYSNGYVSSNASPLLRSYLMTATYRF
jgi:iron complex outermembrane receptor protein